MELLEAIKTRRSIRKFKEEPVAKEVIQELIDTAIWAPSASNRQPWGFVVLTDKNYLKQLSDEAKAGWLAQMDSLPQMQQYRATMQNPDFNIFYNAPALIIIYGKKDSHWSKYDCSMLAQNLMLAAWEKGLGTCWIGFAHNVCDTPQFKAKHNVSEEYELVAPIILGYPETLPKGVVPRKEYPIFYWG
ncbi:nitroreductase [Desulfotomaculum nigrificans CO-1-SRB]|uniref:Nitroreductase n=1 Tax=Desulfotomaculum nigrificans (strain DSM 14880 / VKM B-2319 / CO-1-SRB) TaxID=868595 RepID=F6B3W5_DESCC|nr:nitroreductase [Desulfotomaculum nigrificans]AEF92930.1 nitroreductase [Desulfotomaculum nigrificans CO-1-SRB]